MNAFAPFAPMNPVAIYQHADRFDLLRCQCAECRVLDARYPGQGFQLRLPLRPTSTR